MGTLAKAIIGVCLIALVVIGWAEMSTPRMTTVDIQTAQTRASKGSGASSGSTTAPLREQRVSDTKRSSAAPLRRGNPLDPILVESSRHGFVPRIGPNGRKPSDHYAAPAPLGDGPRIGIVIAGFGLRSALVKQALKQIEQPISLAFTPYGDDLETQVQAARDRGHETFLLVPVAQQRGAGDARGATRQTDAGPKAILAGLDSKARKDRLTWILSRFGGYVGGIALAKTEPTGIAKGFATRGLLFVSADSAYVRAGGRLVIQPAPSATEAAVRRRLDEAGKAAKKSRIIVVLPALPVSIKAFAKWAREQQAESAGVTPAPASAILK